MHFTDDVGHMCFSVYFFSLQMTWEFAFFGYVRLLSCRLHTLLSEEPCAQTLRKTTHLFGWWCRAHCHDLQLALAANGCAVEERQHSCHDHDPNLSERPSQPADLPTYTCPKKAHGKLRKITVYDYQHVALSCFNQLSCFTEASEHVGHSEELGAETLDGHQKARTGIHDQRLPAGSGWISVTLHPFVSFRNGTTMGQDSPNMKTATLEGQQPHESMKRKTIKNSVV